MWVKLAVCGLQPCMFTNFIRAPKSLNFKLKYLICHLGNRKLLLGTLSGDLNPKYIQILNTNEHRSLTANADD